MTDAQQFYTGKALTSLYSTVRPKLPLLVLKKILGFLSEKFNLRDCVAVDVGCGSVQSSVPLADHLKQVIGVDISPDQIHEGNRQNTRSNLSYKVGCAEKLPIPDSSVHLVLASNAAHWFDLAAFFKEVDRVLLPNGVLAVDCNTMTWWSVTGYDNTKMPQIIELADDVNDEYWSVTLPIQTYYENMDLPYNANVRKEKIIVPEKITVAAVMNRIKSIAGVSKFMKAKPEEAQARLQNFQDRFMKFLVSNSSPEQTEMTLNWLYILCLTRKPMESSL